MSFYEEATTFAGRPVVEFPRYGPPPEVSEPVAWRFGVWEYDPSEPDGVVSPLFLTEFEQFVETAGATVEALVIGSWGYPAFNPAPLEAIVAAAPRLPRLRALFLGDITAEECEVSWMKVGDVSVLLDAFPGLETLRVRGGEDFGFSPVEHAALTSLTVESGGLDSGFVRAVLASQFPALTDLSLWLGSENYGGTTTLDDLAPLLAGEVFPRLRRLGLRNSDIADQLAAALADAPIVSRLERLDLSLGTLGDTGIEALLAGQPLTHLDELDLHHHFLGDEVMATLPARLPGVRLDLSDQEQDADDVESRYTAVSE